MISRLPYSVRSKLGLKPAAAPRERVYAIGDIHGCMDLLRQLLSAIGADHSGRHRLPIRLILLGDFIDRGPQSAEVLLRLRTIEERSKRVTVLMGNHESALLDCIDGDGDMQREWLEFGGRSTLASFGIDPPRAAESPKEFGERIAAGLGPENVEWLRNLPLSTRSGDYFFCHAGVRPHIPLHRQDADDLLTIRDEFLVSKRNHGAVIVHGHSIVPGSVQFHPNRIGVDTGAFTTGRLSAVGLEGTERWYVTSHQSGTANQGFQLWSTLVSGQ